MQKLIEGLHEFQATIFSSNRDLFERLALGQSPDALFITCSDSRIDPNLILQAVPGDLFILRNAGNIIPPYGASNGGEGATIEFAVAGLSVKDVIVCGHSHCGAIKGLLNPDAVASLPLMAAWLGHAEATRQIVEERYGDRAGEALLDTAIEENVLVQLENLRTHPAVAARLRGHRLKLHAWVYDIESGQIFAYHPDDAQFMSITERSPVHVAPPARLSDVYSI